MMGCIFQLFWFHLCFFIPQRMFWSFHLAQGKIGGLVLLTRKKPRTWRSRNLDCSSLNQAVAQLCQLHSVYPRSRCITQWEQNGVKIKPEYEGNFSGLKSENTNWGLMSYYQAGSFPTFEMKLTSSQGWEEEPMSQGPWKQLVNSKGLYKH